MIGVFFWLLLSFLCGFLTISALGYKSLFKDRYLTFAFSLITGFGMSSLVAFIWLVLNNGRLGYYPMFEALLLAFLFFLWLKNYFKIRKESGEGDKHSFAEQEVETEEKLGRSFERFVIISFVLCFAALFFLGSRIPHGLWDSWAIWNLKARFLFRAGEAWAEAFTNKISFSHPDYPLFLPLTVVRGWLYCSKENYCIQILFAVLSSFAVLCALFGEIRLQRNAFLAIIAVLTMFATPSFLKTGISQYADVLISLLFLGSLILINRYLADQDRSILKLLGLVTGLSAWVKNEGLLFFCVVTAILASESFLRQRRLQDVKEFLRDYVVGALPALIVLLVFKLGYAPANDLFEKGLNLAEKLTFSRIKFIFIVMWIKLFLFGEWDQMVFSLFNPPVLMIAYFLFNGVCNKNRAGTVCLLILLLMLVGYFAVFVISPHDIQWHLKTACNRLYLQLWPGFVFAFFMTFVKNHKADN